MKETVLRNLNWQVKGFWPWVPFKVNSMELGQELLGVTDWLPATVPGGVHGDLFKAGLIDDPWYELNSLKCEWVENRWWIYQTLIDAPRQSGGRTELVFNGLDYEAVIYLNGQWLGEHKGMYHPACFDITSCCSSDRDERLTLTVLLKHAPDEMAQIGLTSRTHTQKSRFNYKWDFSTRLVNIGIWQDVALRTYGTYSLEDLHIATDLREGVGEIRIAVSVCDGQTGQSGQTDAGTTGSIGIGNDRKSGGGCESESSKTDVDGMDKLLLTTIVYSPDGGIVHTDETVVDAQTSKIKRSIDIVDPQVWHPNGYGSQPLYRVTLHLSHRGVVIDERTVTTGIRSLAYAANEESPADAFPYTFVVNGKRIYIKGVNMVPIDHLYGNIKPAQYEYMVLMMKRAHVNMVRVWGGGLIETELFYDLCDKHGILVWQEFIQSSSGVDNIPSKLPDYLALLERSAIHALKRKRNHAALAVWSGGNELMSAHDRPSTLEDENLAMLQSLVRELDPQRLFLPTSASGPVEYITREKGVSHDVHGHWVYLGNPEHYETYTDVDYLFHSEFGAAGVSPVKSLRKFMSEERCKPLSMQDDLVWRHHGEWWDTLQRDMELFGPIPDLRQFADCSQWIQAESLRFVLEANRARKFRNSGSIIWQLNEPFPNASNTSLIDYYGEHKMAYYWMRKAFASFHVSAQYKKLNFAVGENMEIELFAHGHAKLDKLQATATLYNGQGKKLAEKMFLGSLDGEHAGTLGNWSIPVTSEFEGLFMLRLRLLGEDGAELSVQDCFYGTNREQVYRPALTLSRQSEVSFESCGDWLRDASEGLPDAYSRTYMVKNTGDVLALHVRAEEHTDGYWLEASDSHFTLLPGERKEVQVACMRKSEGGFPGIAGESSATLPEVTFRSFG